MDVASLIIFALVSQASAADPFGNSVVAPPPASLPVVAPARYGTTPASPPPPNFLVPSGSVVANTGAATTVTVAPAVPSPPAALPPTIASPPASNFNITAPPNVPTATIGLPTSAATLTSATTPAAVAAPPTTPANTDPAAALLRESVVLPKSLLVPGRPTTLLDALRNVDDRRRQLAVVAAYWKLSGAAAEYHFAWQNTQLLKLSGEAAASVAQGPDAARAKAEIESRSATAQAEWREAELKLAAAQHALAEAASLPTELRPPLALDLPHTGVYHTSFEKVYARRAPSAQAHLLNRTLPLRHEVVGVRAKTVAAAQDAFEAAFDAYRRGQIDIDEVLHVIDALNRHRREFMAAVERYNNEIAEYAFAGAPDGTSRETLVGMLIKTEFTPKLGRAVAPADVQGILPATFVGPAVPDAISATGSEIGELPASPVVDDETSAGVPGLFEGASGAAPLGAAVETTIPVNVLPSAPAVPLRNEPTLAPPQQPSESPLKFKVNRVPFDEPADTSANTGSSPSSGPYSSNSAAQTITLPPASPNPAIIPPATVATPPAAGASVAAQIEGPAIVRDEQVEPVGYYSNLLALPPDRKTQALVEWLHVAAADSSSKTADTKLTLAECVAMVADVDRPTIIADYWTAAERATRRVALLQKSEQLDALAQAALRLRDSAGGAVAMLAVRTEQLANSAAMLEADAGWFAAQWRLTADLRRPLADRWIRPTTPPHAAGYQTRLETLSASLAGSPRVQDASQRIAVRHEIMQQRATAVAAADFAAEAALQKFAAGQSSVRGALDAVDRQARETDALLATTTRYNLDIADYVSAVLPSSTPDAVLVGALVVDRNPPVAQ